jgi:hypothetical protein
MKAVPPAGVKACWTKIRPELEKMSGLADGWLPEDVYVFLVYFVFCFSQQII